MGGSGCGGSAGGASAGGEPPAGRRSARATLPLPPDHRARAASFSRYLTIHPVRTDASLRRAHRRLRLSTCSHPSVCHAFFFMYQGAFSP